MAVREVIQFIDDLDGSKLDQDNHKEVRFSVNGAHYIIDLSVANEEKFFDAIRPYVQHARRDSHTRGRSTTRARQNNYGVSPKVVRQWAQDNGIDVAPRGQLPYSLYERYLAEH